MEGLRARQEELRQRMASRRSGQRAAQQEHNALPHPWKSAVDAASGRPYYYNLVTGETTWEAPVAPVPDAAASAPADGSREQGELQAPEQANSAQHSDGDSEVKGDDQQQSGLASLLLNGEGGKEEREEAEREAEEDERKEEAEREAKEAERRAKEEARAKDEAETKAKEEAARKEAEQRAQQEANRKAEEEEEANKKAKEEREEADRRAKEEREAAERRAEQEREAVERKAKEDAAAKAKDEEERRAQEEAEKKLKEEREAAERRAKEEREAAERKAKEDVEAKAKAEEERRAQEEAEKKLREEGEAAERRAEEEREEADRRTKEEGEAADHQGREEKMEYERTAGRAEQGAREDGQVAKEAQGRAAAANAEGERVDAPLDEEALRQDSAKRNSHLEKLREEQAQRRRIMKIRRAVMAGKMKRTPGGLTADDLVINKRGKLVSRAASEQGKIAYAKSLKAWIDAVLAARAELNITGFVAINGQTPEGQELYRAARAMYDLAKRRGKAP